MRLQHVDVATGGGRGDDVRLQLVELVDVVNGDGGHGEHPSRSPANPDPDLGQLTRTQRGRSPMSPRPLRPPSPCARVSQEGRRPPDFGDPDLGPRSSGTGLPSVGRQGEVELGVDANLYGALPRRPLPFPPPEAL